MLEAAVLLFYKLITVKYFRNLKIVDMYFSKVKVNQCQCPLKETLVSHDTKMLHILYALVYKPVISLNASPF